MTHDDQELCLCFHVTRRKVIQYIRVNRPTVTSQLSECYGAGTGCGWCRPFLERLMQQTDPESVPLPDAETYAKDRAVYRETR
ncbi:Nitrite reductase [NAD(P)H] [Rubripirellula tenax]|uniref:Nitrite reductase [NAD(P)H] n=1 Tax=Rubripirellula tenax TaxID=2528015 RepID=A0A5C6F4E2_9BACT|nr:(2Fe-2S)-binding protein [Rubripirellula tenax]TWU56613.1 Nitrite reductase [NAD(P)H] [Rubripirellula tenax]